MDLPFGRTADRAGSRERPGRAAPANRETAMTLTELYRHPVKSLGEEALDKVVLSPGAPMPHDRVWAIAHGETALSDGAKSWAAPRNFVNQTHVPRLVQTTCAFDDATGTLSLAHPDLPDLTVRPGSADGDAALTDWIAPLTDGTTRRGPFRICAVPGVAFTDFEETHISIASTASRSALGEIVGQPLAAIRFRMNLWVEGWEPWAEMAIEPGTEIAVGPARLQVIGRCERCNATTANPNTGRRDAQIPAELFKNFGHRDFGLYAQVVESGEIAPGARVRVL